MYASLLIDVEDFITPEADDAALDVARIVTEEGFTATICVVGEKARCLLARGREDVIAALGMHDIGLHTDKHSVHPTTCEYLSDCDWQTGVTRAREDIERGLDAIGLCFGVEPSCWGGAGNTWGPQVNEALWHVRIPALVYSHLTPQNGDLHRFLGVRCFPSGLYLGDAMLHQDDTWRKNLNKLLRGLERRRSEGVQWSEVFLCHPSRVRCEEFWDGINFSNGANPRRSHWRPAPLKSQEDYRRALGNLRLSLRALGRLEGIRWATIGEMAAHLRFAEEVPLTSAEVAATRTLIEERLQRMGHWPIHKPGMDFWRISELTLELLDDLVKLKLDE